MRKPVWHEIEVLSFDCYGTLVDWETGILRALLPILGRRGTPPDPEAVLEAYARAEAELESGEYRPYREVLRDVVERLAVEHGLRIDDRDREALVEGLPGWEPFPDAREALEALSWRFRLAVCSNVDRDLFERTRRRLGARFDWVVTAEDVRAYKPKERVFAAFREASGAAPGRWAHVAQSLYHDVGPAAALGARTVWVDRRTGRKGGGAVSLPTHGGGTSGGAVSLPTHAGGTSGGAVPPRPTEARPDAIVPDLVSLARWLLAR